MELCAFMTMNRLAFTVSLLILNETQGEWSEKTLTQHNAKFVWIDNIEKYIFEIKN